MDGVIGIAWSFFFLKGGLAFSYDDRGQTNFHFQRSRIIGSEQWWCCEDGTLLCQSKIQRRIGLVGEDGTGIGPRSDLTCEAIDISCTLWRSTRKKGFASLQNRPCRRQDRQRPEQVAVKKKKRKKTRRKKKKAIIQESTRVCP